MDSKILDKFPKVRVDLPEAYRKIYNEHYFTNRNGNYKTTSLSKRLESWMHKKIASDIISLNKNYSTLEIGAGTLNQLEFEGECKSYDIVEPFIELYKDSPMLNRVRNIYSDISGVSGKYDRITTVATFEHIMDLPYVVAKSSSLLNKDGHLRVSVPNEGSIAWKMGTMVTGYEFKKKYGLDYSVLMKYEHVNTSRDIEDVLKYFFNKVKCSYFGISKRLSFYHFYDCSEPALERVDEYFKRHSNL